MSSAETNQPDISVDTLGDEVSEALINAVAKAMDTQFPWSINLTRLVDGDATYTLTFPGYEPADFSDHDSAHEALAARLSRERAKLVLAALASADGLTTTQEGK